MRAFLVLPMVLASLGMAQADAPATALPTDQTVPAPRPGAHPSLDQALIDVVRKAGTDRVGKGDADKVASLLAQGADPNAKDKLVSPGTSALEWALNFGKDDAAQLLIRHGADGSVEDSHGENAAWLAARIYYCPGALDLLIKKGVNVTGLNKHGEGILLAMMHVAAARPGKMNYLSDRIWTPAEYQAYQARERRVVELLIAAGADFNGKDGTKTPLISAVESGHAEAIRVLLEHGANRAYKDPQGDTALSLAQDTHPDLVQLFQEHSP